MTPAIYTAIGLIVAGIGLLVTVISAVRDDHDDAIIILVVGVSMSLAAGFAWPFTVLIALLWLVVQGIKTRRAAEKRRVAAERTPPHE